MNKLMGGGGGVCAVLYFKLCVIDKIKHTVL